MTPGDNIETPKVETAEAKALREKQEFDDNLNKVQNFINDPTNKTEEQELQLNILLNNNFQKGLKALECDTVKSINDLVTIALQNSIDAGEKAVLINIQTLLKPLIVESKIDVKFNKDASNVVITGKEKVKYNADKGKDFLATTISTINTIAYANLPGRDKILAALQTPTKENIASLQKFLYESMKVDKVDQATLDLFVQKNQKNGGWDGMFGPNTNTALNAHLNAFIAFQESNKVDITNISANQSAADKLAEDNTKLMTSINEATVKLDTHFQTYKEADYMPASWNIMKQAKIDGDKAIREAITPALVITAETKAEDAMKAVPTKKQEIIDKKAGIEDIEEDLKNINLTTLPKDVQKKINSIKKLTDRDDKVEGKIQDAEDKIQALQAQISALENSNKDKSKQVKEIDIIQAGGVNNKGLKKTERILNNAIDANNIALTWLRQNLADQQDRLQRLTKKDERKDVKLAGKLVAINELLQKEINKRNTILPQIQSPDRKQELNDQITAMTDVQGKINTLITENDGLAALVNPKQDTKEKNPNISNTKPEVVNAPRVYTKQNGKWWHMEGMEFKQDEILTNFINNKDYTKSSMFDNAGVGPATFDFVTKNRASLSTNSEVQTQINDQIVFYFKKNNTNINYPKLDLKKRLVGVTLEQNASWQYYFDIPVSNLDVKKVPADITNIHIYSQSTDWQNIAVNEPATENLNNLTGKEGQITPEILTDWDMTTLNTLISDLNLYTDWWFVLSKNAEQNLWANINLYRLGKDMQEPITWEWWAEEGNGLTSNIMPSKSNGMVVWENKPWATWTFYIRQLSENWPFSVVKLPDTYRKITNPSEQTALVSIPDTAFTPIEGVFGEGDNTTLLTGISLPKGIDNSGLADGSKKQ